MATIRRVLFDDDLAPHPRVETADVSESVAVRQGVTGAALAVKIGAPTKETIVINVLQATRVLISAGHASRSRVISLI